MTPSHASTGGETEPDSRGSDSRSSPERGEIWQRLKDGVHFEVVWSHQGFRNAFTGYVRPPMVQLRRAGAQNLKNTHWIQQENLPKLYRRA